MMPRLLVVFLCVTTIALCRASPAPRKYSSGRIALQHLRSRRNLLADDSDTDLSPSARVIHGTPVESKDEYQFVVDLAKDPEHISTSRFCTGTLIKANIVLTAAHWYV